MQQHGNRRPQPDAITAFKQFYEQFDQASFHLLDDIYADSVTFSDPIHRIEGLPNLKAYFEHMCHNLSDCRFHFLSELISSSQACFKWEMHYQHPSLKSNAPLTLSGVTLITFSDKVESHEDFYDMGAMLYEHLPVMGGAIRFLKSRMIKESEC